jgi:short-subunit dehydrogenase
MPDTSNTLQGKVVVITGASSGFGRGAALAFATRGCNLVLAARREGALDEVARECEHHGVKAIPLPTDVSEYAQVAALASVARETFSRIDIWVNDAGVGAIGRFEDIPLLDHIQVLATNLNGTLYGCYYAYRQMLDQGQGTLINIASELGKHTVPYYSSYTAAKHGVVGLSASLRQEISQGPHAGYIHVCTILPTAHDTPFFDHAANYSGHEIQAPNPLHDPLEVVEAIVAVAEEPDNERIVGGDGLLKVAMRSLMPAVAERADARFMHRTQYENAPEGPDSAGAVQIPVAEGTEVSAGRREQG